MEIDDAALLVEQQRKIEVDVQHLRLLDRAGFSACAMQRRYRARCPLRLNLREGGAAAGAEATSDRVSGIVPHRGREK